MGIYVLTLAAFMVSLPAMERRGRWVRVLVWTSVLCGLFEVFYITWQGMWGQASHFNNSSPFHATMYSLMGAGAVLLITSSLVLAFQIARSAEYQASSVMKLGIVLGLGLTWVLGLGFGGYMSTQLAGHWVGSVGSDTRGIPLVGWSRASGDLRVPHFFGIHAMHFLPAFSWLVVRARVPEPQAKKWVWAFAAALSALTIASFLQARAGLPLLASELHCPTDRMIRSTRSTLEA